MGDYIKTFVRHDAVEEEIKNEHQEEIKTESDNKDSNNSEILFG